MATRSTIESTIANLCDGFNTQNTALVVAQFAATGRFDDLLGQSHIGHQALTQVFDAMFEGDPTAQYHLTEQLVDPPTKALIAWHKTSETGEAASWWAGLDLLIFDDQGQIMVKSVYAKTVTPLVHGGLP